ncbi:hypothetical protein [Paenibacillus peoriae]|uniref:hypothetical protein n=1 Tax=Paenibacillus peoriae TaxID=59893 RepID=UPI00026C616E|nr:hypothetical protein [Paenibacillus peoriae]MEC0183117.1 hypothetical protein [Paenibacillus peoriae]
MEIDLVRLLNSIGKRVFVEYYEVFSNNQMSNDEKISKLPEEYKINGSRTRVNCANKIFESGLEKEALNIIVNSRTEKKAIEKAETLLKNI